MTTTNKHRHLFRSLCNRSKNNRTKICQNTATAPLAPASGRSIHDLFVHVRFRPWRKISHGHLNFVFLYNRELRNFLLYKKNSERSKQDTFSHSCCHSVRNDKNSNKLLCNFNLITYFYSQSSQQKEPLHIFLCMQAMHK